MMYQNTRRHIYRSAPRRSVRLTPKNDIVAELTSELKCTRNKLNELQHTSENALFLQSVIGEVLDKSPHLLA